MIAPSRRARWASSPGPGWPPRWSAPHQTSGRSDELDKTFAWWLRQMDPASQGAARQAGRPGRRGDSHQEAGNARARDARAIRAGHGVSALSWRVRQAPRSGQAGYARRPAARCRSDLPKNRLGLAMWLVRPEHPLTARVTVNRFWQEVFGTGLVRTSGDFGVSGELPSHPELLDWLAVEFRESGWDVKRLFRLMVESATYRQSAASPPEKREKDPSNRLLSCGPRFRMDGEMIRDSALCASGLLAARQGGPSVKPYQPEGVWEAVAMPESNTKRYEPDHGDRLYRRTLYTFWKRSAARRRWKSSTRRLARSARSAASGPTRRSRRWSRSTTRSLSRRPEPWPSRHSKRLGPSPELCIDYHRPPAAEPALPAPGNDDRSRIARQAERLLSVAPRPRRQAARRRRVEGRSLDRPGDAGRLDDAHQRADEPG